MANFKMVQNEGEYWVETHRFAKKLCFISTPYHKRMAYPLPTIQVQKNGDEFFDEDAEGYGPGILEPLPANASTRIVHRLEAGQHLAAMDIPAEAVLKELGLTANEVKAYTSGRGGLSYTVWDPDDYAATFVAEWETSGDDTPGIEEFRQRWGCDPDEFADRLKAGTLPKHSRFEETGCVTDYGEPIWFVVERHS